MQMSSKSIVLHMQNIADSTDINFKHFSFKKQQNFDVIRKLPLFHWIRPVGSGPSCLIQNSGYLTSLLLANQNRYANEVINMHIWWRQTTWVVLVPPHYSHTKFDENRSLPSCSGLPFFALNCWWDLTGIHTYICMYRQRYKWKLSGPSSIADGPQ